MNVITEIDKLDKKIAECCGMGINELFAKWGKLMISKMTIVQRMEMCCLYELNASKGFNEVRGTSEKDRFIDDEFVEETDGKLYKTLPIITFLVHYSEKDEHLLNFPPNAYLNAVKKTKVTKKEIEEWNKIGGKLGIVNEFANKVREKLVSKYHAK